MVVALMSLRQVLLTCMYTCAAFSFILISPLEGLTSRQTLLDSKTPISSLLSLMRPPFIFIPWKRSILLSTSVIIPLFPYYSRIYFVISCSLPFSSLKITDTMPVLDSSDGFPMQQKVLRLSRLKTNLSIIDPLSSLRRASKLAISCEW
jgi:hypothetical protein